jgi:hypothetical protein
MLTWCGTSVKRRFDMSESTVVVKHEVHDLLLTADTTGVVTKCCHYSLAVIYYNYNLIINESWSSTIGVAIEPELA